MLAPTDVPVILALIALAGKLIDVLNRRRRPE